MLTVYNSIRTGLAFTDLLQAQADNVLTNIAGYEQIVHGLLYLHIWLLTFRGTFSTWNLILDIAIFTTAVLMCTEVWVRALYGDGQCPNMTILKRRLDMFWFRRDAQVEFAHRVDLVCCTVGLFGALLMLIILPGEPNWFRGLLSLPAARLLTINPDIRKIIWSLLLALPQVLDMFALMLVCGYVASVYGVWFFYGTFEMLDLTEEGVDVYCSTLEDCAFLHLQLLIGSNWHEIMWGATRMEGGWVIYWFVVYMMVFNVLLTDLLTGVICTSFGVAYDNKHPTMQSMALDRIKARQEALQKKREEEEE